MKITPLGAGSEVGRSCIIVEFKGKTIMVITKEVVKWYMDTNFIFLPLRWIAVFIRLIREMSALPFWWNWSGQCRHCFNYAFPFGPRRGAALFMEKTNFKGKVFMTHPTKSHLQVAPFRLRQSIRLVSRGTTLRWFRFSEKFWTNHGDWLSPRNRIWRNKIHGI